jgi:aryl-alcohol dehydrogenase-like predicted oxidoreductase
LGSTGIETSDIGFGTAGLTSAGGRRAAVRLLEQAFEEGITHFDTAPLYGRGQVEGLVGRFLRDKRNRVTVTTKIGLYPGALDRRFRFLIGPLRRVKQALSRAAAPAVDVKRPQEIRAGIFDAQQARVSFDASLRELQTDYVDLLLLHGCFVEDALRPDVLEFIGRQIERGTVRAAGVGTARSNLQDRDNAIPDLFRAFQYEHNISRGEMLPGKDNRALITHTALGPLRRLVSTARNDASRAAKARSESGVDFSEPAAVAPMLLHCARRTNTGGVLLFATTKREHLHDNVAGLRLEPSPEQMTRFAAAARSLLAVGE